MYKKFIALLSLLISLNTYAVIIPTVFGDVNEEDPLILKLLDSKAIQRLKHIDQSGPEAYFSADFPKLSRYDHSLGVYALLKRYEVSNAEQVAGLLHDASHTVFSHLGDIVFQSGKNRDQSYQDNIHDWFLTKIGVATIIAPHNLTLADISPKNVKFTALEEPYPDMNADRIEYNLHTALVFKDLDMDDVNKILSSLKYSNNKWYFTDVLNAKKFATLSTYYTKAFWGNPHNIALYTASSAAIRYALQNNLISSDEMHFGVDETVVYKLRNTTDPTLRKLVAIIKNIEAYYKIADRNNYDVFQPIKMRGIDPLVLQNGKMHRLSDLSTDFRNDLQLTKEHVERGACIKFINVQDPTVLKLLRSANA